MDLPNVTTTFADEGNRGLQVEYNSGSGNLATAEHPETPPLPACFVPFRRDPDFVDRATLLAQIREKCSVPASRVALVGLGGVGKSQLAIEHCYHTAEQSPGTWVFWVHASNTARLEQSFHEIAEQAKVRGRHDSQVDIFKLVHDWLRNEKNGQWLLVLDNADDAGVFRSSAEEIGSSDSRSAFKQHLSKCLPLSRHGSVLVTSRTLRAAMQLVEDSDIIPIEPMDDAAAHALLRTKLGDKADSDGGIAELAATLDFIPLALVQAAAYIRERAPRCTLRQYLEEYRRSNRRKTSLLNYNAGHLRRDETASNSVILTWQISFDHIHSTKRSAADLLSLMSFFDRQGIQEAVLCPSSATTDNDGFEDDITILRDFSFITVTRDATTFEMYSLVQLATHKWLESQGQLDKWREQFISNLCAEMPTGHFENWDECQALFPHARAALVQRPRDKESLKKWALLLYNASWYAWQQGRAGEAEEMATVSMDVRREVLSGEHADTLSSMNMVGLARERRGKYEEAEAMHRTTLALREKLLGPEHLDTLVSMDNLAIVLRSQGKYEEAEVRHRTTVALREKLLGPEHPDTLVSMDNLAIVLRSQGKYEEAEVMHRTTLALREKLLGPEHLDTLVSMDNLAIVLRSQGKYEEAEVRHRTTVALREKLLGPEHPDTLVSMNNLAIALDSQGRYKEAEAMHIQILALRETVLGRDHPDTITSASNLGSVTERPARYEEAEVKPAFAYQTSVGFGTYIGQNSVEISQEDTLIGQEERTIMSEKRNAEMPDDRSIASHTTTRRERQGKDYIARFLADDVEVRLLCSSVLDKIDREQFVDIGRQMLKSYYLGLLEHATTELEKQCVRLLKSSSGRQRICEGIADIIKLEDAQNKEERSMATEQKRLAEVRLEMFKKDLPDTYLDLDPNQPPEIETELPTDYIDSIELEGQGTVESDDGLPNLARMKEFFRESEAFQVLLNDLRTQLLPHSIRDVIQTAPQGSLWLSDQHNNSLSNRMKAFVEDFTMLGWNWWPLEPRMRNLTSSETRLFWHCSCGTRLWQEISRDDAILIKPILLNRTTESALLRRCKQNRGLPSLVAKFIAFAARQSAAGSQDTGTRSGSNNPQNPAQAIDQVAGSGAYNTTRQQATSINPRILFGVNGPNPALKLEQIEINDTTNDSDFYDDLRKHYMLNRGKFRYWFSFWRLGNCEVVKYQTYRLHYVLKEHKDLPRTKDYDYFPRYPEAQNPPVSQHEFSMHLNACGVSCHWALLKDYVPIFGNLLHGCLPRLNTKRAIRRIPKKKSPFDTSSTDDRKTYAWGLEAKHEISATYVAFYHLLILILPFSFWGWWQTTHPGDLQNASIPVTVVLTMLSLFWGTNGILTQGRKLGEMDI